jgi:hypothetical protein
LTDPFSDFKLYCKAPLRLLHGEMSDAGHSHEDADGDEGLVTAEQPF